MDEIIGWLSTIGIVLFLFLFTVGMFAWALDHARESIKKDKKDLEDFKKRWSVKK